MEPNRPSPWDIWNVKGHFGVNINIIISINVIIIIISIISTSSIIIITVIVLLLLAPHKVPRFGYNYY